MSSYPECTLCDTCVYCLKNDDDELAQSHHLTVSSFMRSVAEGCYFCTSFHNEFTAEEREAFSKPSQDSVVSDIPYLMEWQTVDIESREQGPTAHVIALSGPDFRQVHKRMVPCIGHAPIKTDNISETLAIESMRSWLSTCEREHTTCNPDNACSWYPKRLLDVRPEAGSRIVELVESTEHQISGDYWTLSHCWGDGEFLQLNEKTRPSFASGIDISRLPQTFQDAISLCLGMNVRFLWIDSLCIQQDDHADWLVQSAEMDKIYSSAQCNISADACSSSQQSLFRERDPDLFQRRIVDVPSESRHPVPGKYLITAITGEYGDIMRASPVNKRAWVLQERIMAKRVIHFTNQELIWECGELAASEAFPSGLPFELNYKNIRGKDGELNDAHLREMWDRIVFDYSGMSLTFPDDRPIALSAIAKLYRSLLQDEYVLGMWKSTFFTDLNWITPPDKHYSRPTIVQKQRYRHPSFSWLSSARRVDPFGNVHGTFLNAVECAELVKLDIQYVNEDTTGLVHDGQLWLKGRLRLLSPDSGDVLNCQRVALNENSAPVLLRVFPDIAHDDYLRLRRHSNVYVFPLLDTDGTKSGLIFGLVLAQVDATSSTFNRIGQFAFAFDPEHLSQTAKRKERLFGKQKGEEAFPCESYDRETSSHVIRIQ